MIVRRRPRPIVLGFMGIYPETVENQRQWIKVQAEYVYEWFRKYPYLQNVMGNTDEVRKFDELLIRAIQRNRAELFLTEEEKEELATARCIADYKIFDYHLLLIRKDEQQGRSEP